MNVKLLIVFVSLFCSTLCNVITANIFDAAESALRAGPINSDSPVKTPVITQTPNIVQVTDETVTNTTTKVPDITTPSTAKAPDTPAPTTEAPDTPAPTTKEPDTTTSTTTKAPDTTTQGPVATTVAPPSPPTGPLVVSVTATSNVTCIVAQMLIDLEIHYPTIDNKTGIANVTINNGTAVRTSGVCGNDTQLVSVGFGPHSLNITFATNATAKDYYVSGVILSVNATSFPNISMSAINATDGMITYRDNHTLFETPLKMSYKCNKLQSLNLTSSSNETWVTALNISNTQIEAFRNVTTLAFGDAQDCEPYSTPDIVPIAVGCALATLVVVVLVAYLIGRRRSTARGYVSMTNEE